MVPGNKSEALEGLKRVWGDSPETRVGRAILDLLSENLDNAFLPLSVFFDSTNSTLPDEKAVVLNVVNFFAGASQQLIRIQLEYIDGDEVMLLDDDAAKAATEHGVNPITGETDSELGTKIFLCLSPSDIARRVLKK
ncbi:hypothetical protein [Kerstersia gyiorum]|uniref:hypothetical protein n=1 Tax=Kerstersia gyiorum TaxID=206506 RepID=UPI003B436953